MVHDNTVHRGVIYPGAFKRIEQEKAKAAEVERANPAFHYKIKWIVRVHTRYSFDNLQDSLNYIQLLVIIRFV